MKGLEADYGVRTCMHARCEARYQMDMSITFSLDCNWKSSSFASVGHSSL